MSQAYEVGYGKPPTASRFRKGRSGNPKGRPKANTNLRSALKVMMHEDVPIQGKGSTISKSEAIVRTLVDNAMNGNQRAFRRFLVLANRAGLFDKLKDEPVANPGVVRFAFNCETIQAERDRIRAAKQELLARHKGGK